MKSKKYHATKVISTGLLLVFFTLNSCKDDFDALPELVESEQTSTSNITTFVHPGIINTQRSLSFIRQQYENIAPEYNFRREAFSKVLEWITNNEPSAHVKINKRFTVYVQDYVITPSERNIKGDAMLAYAYALAWATTGSSVYSGEAKKILNAYAKNFVKLTNDANIPTAQIGLEAAWIAPTFAAAAEIIRDYERIGTGYAGWSSFEANNFGTFLNKLKDYINRYIIDSTGDTARKNSNWGVSAGYAKMAIGVYLKRSTDYESGLTFIKNRLLANVIQPTGFIPDRGHSDCWHYQYSLTGFTYAAEIARIHNDQSIYTYGNGLLRTAFNYQYYTYLALTNRVQGDNRNCVGYTNIYPGVEIASRYYDPNNLDLANLRAINDPNSVVTDFTFFGFTTYTHYAVPLNP